MGDKNYEIISWLIDNTNEMTDNIDRWNTLVNFRRLIYRLILFITFSFVDILLILDCPTSMFNLGMHSFAIKFLQFNFPSFLFVICVSFLLLSHSDSGTVGRSCDVLKAFFLTTKSFNEKEQIKNDIDVNRLLNLCCCPNELLANSAGWLLLYLYSIYTTADDEEEHPDYGIMKRNGTLEKMYSTFKECSIEEVKRLIGFVFINIDRECSMGDQNYEIISWFIDNTNEMTDNYYRENTLVHFRRLIYRLILFITFSIVSIILILDCPSSMFNLGIHSFAIKFLQFHSPSFLFIIYVSFLSSVILIQELSVDHVMF
jgi:hypothetical protein